MRILLLFVFSIFSQDLPANFNREYSEYLEKEVLRLYLEGSSSLNTPPEMKSTYIRLQKFFDDNILSNIERKILLSNTIKGDKNRSSYFRSKSRFLIYLDVLLRTTNFYLRTGRNPYPLLELINSYIYENTDENSNRLKVTNLGLLVKDFAKELKKLPIGDREEIAEHYQKIIDSVKNLDYRRRYFSILRKFIEIISSQSFISQEEKEAIIYSTFMETVCENQDTTFNMLVSDGPLLDFAVEVKDNSELEFVNPF